MARRTHQPTPRSVASAQHGVITRGQLADLEFSDEAIDHRLEKGRLFRVHRGVYALGRRELTRHGEWMAAVLACGSKAALSHESAAALLKIATAPTIPIHVSTLTASRSREGIEVHRRTALDTTTIKGIP